MVHTHNIMRIAFILWFLCLLQLLRPDAASAQPPPSAGGKSVRVVRADAPPIIDGRLDEASWIAADVITDFHQIRPGDGATST